jgi:hypothetical protein
MLKEIIIMKFKTNIIKESIMYKCDSEDENGHKIKFIEESGWIDEGKYSYNSWIFQYQDKYYIVYDSRSGSYFSDYCNDSDDWGEYIECDEVEKKEKITHEWVAVK